MGTSSAAVRAALATFVGGTQFLILPKRFRGSTDCKMSAGAGQSIQALAQAAIL